MWWGPSHNQMVEKEGSTPSGGVRVQGVDETVDEVELAKHGLEVVNAVATVKTGREFDLTTLSADLPNSEYEPEHSPFLVYRPEGNPTLLVPSNGLVSVVGAKGVDDIERGIYAFFSELEHIGVELSKQPGDVTVQNIVVKGGFQLEFDLDTLAIEIGLERCEYEPEQFPGLIFRTDRGSTILIFRTGAYLIMGLTSYDEVLEEFFDLHNELEPFRTELGP